MTLYPDEVFFLVLHERNQDISHDGEMLGTSVIFPHGEWPGEKQIKMWQLAVNTM